MIDSKVQKAIDAALQSFTAYTPIDVSELKAKLTDVFAAEEDFLDKVDALDDVFDDYPQVEALREVFFDLLMVNFFSADINRLEEDYLDSPEWEEIEEETLDRGTELLNVLLYLNECNDESIEPSLEDYLEEFLLVGDDEFQDEHQIYEPVIANQILVESTPAEVSRVAAGLPDDDELKDLFYPVMTFFQNVQASEADGQEVAAHAIEKDFDMAVYSILLVFGHD
ncbi:hypothetical protein [Mucilaginibacter lacusdianchii]|uniref:hypothetical protein n=1 Tax=Mucilaginibacter lacusdianchii TaxID=2684211 RepID=UPI001E4D62EF|nr:hypothetical protein [Mucilaginibacter sp. JXJ CY 39]